MKVVSSLKNQKRNKHSQLIRRKGKIMYINKVNPRFKVVQK
jgi:ribosomal protein L36